MTNIIPKAIKLLSNLTAETAQDCRRLKPHELKDLIHQCGEIETSAKGSDQLAVHLIKRVATLIQEEE